MAQGGASGQNLFGTGRSFEHKQHVLKLKSKKILTILL